MKTLKDFFDYVNEKFNLTFDYSDIHTFKCRENRNLGILTDDKDCIFENDTNISKFRICFSSCEDHGYEVNKILLPKDSEKAIELIEEWKKNI